MDSKSLAVEDTSKAANPTVLPEDVAAFYFANLLPIFKERLRNLSRKGAIRVQLALVQAPFMDDVKLTTAEEKDAFTVGMEIADAKTLMLATFIEKHPDQIAKLKEHYAQLAWRMKEGEKKDAETKIS